MIRKTLAGIALAAAALPLAACGSTTSTAPASFVHKPAPSVTAAATPRKAAEPDGMSLRGELKCDHVTPGDQLTTALPETDQKVEDLWGCKWDDHSRSLLAVRLTDADSATTFMGDMIDADHKDKIERDGAWVFVASDDMARYYAHDAYTKADR